MEITSLEMVLIENKNPSKKSGSVWFKCKKWHFKIVRIRIRLHCFRIVQMIQFIEMKCLNTGNKSALFIGLIC